LVEQKLMWCSVSFMASSYDSPDKGLGRSPEGRFGFDADPSSGAGPNVMVNETIGKPGINR
jgi:hypothetical protein